MADYVEKLVNTHVTIIELPHKDCRFPIHTHEREADNHITAVLRGSIEDTASGDVYTAGDVIVWQLNKPHGFRALKANTKLMNVRNHA